MEADSNASYKEIFGNRMLEVVRSHGFMPEEIYSEKTSDECYLSKCILYDIFVRKEIISNLPFRSSVPLLVILTKHLYIFLHKCGLFWY